MKTTAISESSPVLPRRGVKQSGSSGTLSVKRYVSYFSERIKNLQKNIPANIAFRVQVPPLLMHISMSMTVSFIG